MKDREKSFRVGDLVVNTYIGATMHGKLGLVIGFERFGDVMVVYDDQVHRLTGACLEVVSEGG